MLNNFLEQIKQELNNEQEFSLKVANAIKRLDSHSNLYIFAVGKSSQAFWHKMQRCLLERGRLQNVRKIVLFDHIDLEGDKNSSNVLHLKGTHPITSYQSIHCTQTFIAELQKIDEQSTIFFLISGGTSSLLELPHPNFSMDEVIDKHRDLFRLGLPIAELNKRRSELSQVKFGGLLRFIRTKNIVNFLIDDTFDEDPLIVGSGPTIGANIENVIVESASLFLQRARRSISEIFWVKQMAPQMTPEELYLQAKSMQKSMVAIIGEVTFSLPPQAPAGGRNIHLAAYYLNQVLDSKIQLRGFLSFATDGEDGNSDSSGAFFEGNLKDLDKADLKNSIQSFETLKFMKSQNFLIPKTKTSTNIMDIRIFSF
ncbi:MAG: glycerate 2-kinase [Bdellovibrio sp.]